VTFACPIAAVIRGRRNVIRIRMIAMTARSSMSVKPARTPRRTDARSAFGEIGMISVLPPGQRLVTPVRRGANSGPRDGALAPGGSLRGGADGLVERGRAFRALPREALAAEVAVVGGLLVDRLLQVELADDRGGRRSKTFSTAAVSTSSGTLPVPNVSARIDSGFAMPIA
jgi:hypothetical protein